MDKVLEEDKIKKEDKAHQAANKVPAEEVRNQREDSKNVMTKRNARKLNNVVSKDAEEDFLMEIETTNIDES